MVLADAQPAISMSSRCASRIQMNIKLVSESEEVFINKLTVFLNSPKIPS